MPSDAGHYEEGTKSKILEGGGGRGEGTLRDRDTHNMPELLWE